MRLSEPQRTMLAEMQEAGTLYVHRYSVLGRTAQSLSNRKLIECSEPDYSSMYQGWIITDAGKEALGMTDQQLAESIVHKLVQSDVGGYFVGSGPTAGVFDCRIDLTEEEESYIERLKDELL